MREAVLCLEVPNLYSGTSLWRTPLGPTQSSIIERVPSCQGFIIHVHNVGYISVSFSYSVHNFFCFERGPNSQDDTHVCMTCVSHRSSSFSWYCCMVTVFTSCCIIDRQSLGWYANTLVHMESYRVSVEADRLELILRGIRLRRLDMLLVLSIVVHYMHLLQVCKLQSQATPKYCSSLLNN